jgi:L-seryl-tRNA(Ser) seleniumtransferase
VAQSEGASVSNEMYKILPSLNDLVLSPGFALLLRAFPRSAVVTSIRSALDQLRGEISSGLHTRESLIGQVALLPSTVENALRRGPHFSLRAVINATGVILHTNLGRAPLSRSAIEHVVDIASGYTNLELDLPTGERGSRDVHVAALILKAVGHSVNGLTDGYGATVVNNCAAATFLALNALARGRDVIISRGELVEIGGGFRIPEILEQSGAVLKEVGTTNRTRLADYESALSANTGMIMRVHQSNFSMEGFVERPALEDLVRLGKRYGVPVFEDQGTGLILALEQVGISGEETVSQCLEQGCDLVAASGDKLLGGPQCGILVGRKELVDRIRQSPLFRAFRVDKLTLAALEGTLVDYVADDPGVIPIVRMLRILPEELLRRCEWIKARLDNPDLSVEIVPVTSVIGGGTTPKAGLSSFALSLAHSQMKSAALALALRQAETPILGRIGDGRVLLDLRTVDPDFDQGLLAAIQEHLPAYQAHAETSGPK